MTEAKANAILRETRKAYNAVEGSFADAHRRQYGAEVERFVDYVREGEAVLDVGCGEAERYELFRSRRAHYAGVDVSDPLIRRARENLSDEDARFEVGDILDLPVPDERYDAVLAVSVLQHIPSDGYRLRAMEELVRAARPGGYVLMTNWNFWRPKYWHVHLHQLFGKRNGWDLGDLKISWRAPKLPRYFHCFTVKEMRKLCEAAGLEVVELYYVKDGEITGWSRGENLVTIARKPAKISRSET